MTDNTAILEGYVYEYEIDESPRGKLFCLTKFMGTQRHFVHLWDMEQQEFVTLERSKLKGVRFVKRHKLARRFRQVERSRELDETTEASRFACPNGKEQPQ